MIWDLTFSQALLVFALLLTPIYMVILILSEKTGTARGKGASARPNITVIVGLFAVEALLMFLLNLPGFKESLTYSIFLLFIAILLVYALRSSSSSRSMQMLLLASAVLYHLAFVYSPPFGLSIHERAAAVEALTRDGFWDPSGFSPHSVYSPVPMDLEMLGTFSIVTSIPTINPLKDLLVLLISMVGYDVLLYVLCKRVTGSYVAGILAIILLASTPPANFVFHASKWFGSLLALASAMALIKAFDGVCTISNIAIANFCYGMAILFHPSAAIGGFLPLGVVAVSIFAKKALKDGVWERLSESGLLRASAALLITVTFARAIYTAGYLEAMLPSLNSFFSAALGYSAPSEVHTPVYELSVEPINAYSWAIPVAMASALMLYSLLKRKAVGGNFALTMSFVGMVFVFLGYLSAAVKAGGFQGAMYPAFVFLIPLAAALGGRVLRSSRILAVILIVSVTLSVGIASTDPRFSEERYRRTGAGDVDTKVEDFATAVFLTDRIPVGKSLFMPYEIASSFQYLVVVADTPLHRPYTGSADLQREEIDRVVAGNEPLPGVMYVWPRRWLPNLNSHLANTSANIYFDSSRHVVFEK